MKSRPFGDFFFTSNKYNTQMNPTPDSNSSPNSLGTKAHTFIKKAEEEAKKAFALSIYFGIWFCALAFLDIVSIKDKPFSFAIFGFAFFKAAISVKFLLIGQAIIPMKIDREHGIIRSLFVESLFYVLVVLALNYVEAGVHGFIEGKSFMTSMADFGQSNPLKVLAMCIVYWLIVWPCLIFYCMKVIMGKEKIRALFFGDRKQVKH